MCIPYIYRLPDSKSQKRGRNGAPRPPLSVKAVKIQPPNVTFSAEFSPRLIYRTPSDTRRAANPKHPRPSAPHPTPEMQFAEGFAAGEQAGEKMEQRSDEVERKLEEGRAGLPQHIPTPPAPEPRVPPSNPPTGPSQPPPHQQQAPFGWPEPHLIPFPAEPNRLETLSPYSYIRRPPPGYRPRHRSRSSSASLVSRRSFETLSRKVNTMLDRLARLEHWNEERDIERRSKSIRWELGPGHSRDRARRARSRTRDADVERERLREQERWDWEGGGLGR